MTKQCFVCGRKAWKVIHVGMDYDFCSDDWKELCMKFKGVIMWMSHSRECQSPFDKKGCGAKIHFLDKAFNR